MFPMRYSQKIYTVPRVAAFEFFLRFIRSMHWEHSATPVAYPHLDAAAEKLGSLRRIGRASSLSPYCNFFVMLVASLIVKHAARHFVVAQ
jgi:hypothetical protein